MGRKEREGNPSRLREARRERQVSLTDFSHKVGYSRSYLSAVELGHLPETEQIVLAYEAALDLERGTLTQGKQSVARVIDRVGSVSIGRSQHVAAERLVFPHGQMVTLSRDEVIRGMTSLALEAIEGCGTPSEILITSFCDVDDTALPASVVQPWLSVQESLLASGWSITHLLRLNEDVGRSLQLVEMHLPLLASQHDFRLLYGPPGQALTSVQDFLVIPGVGALIRFDRPAEEQAVLLLRDREAVEAVHTNLQLQTADAVPLVEAISREESRAFQHLLAAVEEIPGERVLVRDTILPMATQSLEPEVWLPPTPLTPDILDSDLQALSGKRSQAFVQNVQRFRHRDIAIKGRLEDFVQTSLLVKQGLFLTEASDRFQPLNLRRAIEGVIEMLKAFPNYELALLDSAEVSLIQAEQGESVVYWLVKGGKELLLESWPQIETGETRHLHLAVHESSIATAFQEHFKNIWNRIAPRNRDKDYVMWWLQTQANLLKDP